MCLQTVVEMSVCVCVETLLYCGDMVFWYLTFDIDGPKSVGLTLNLIFRFDIWYFDLKFGLTHLTFDISRFELDLLVWYFGCQSTNILQLQATTNTKMNQNLHFWDFRWCIPLPKWTKIFIFGISDDGFSSNLKKNQR